MSENPRIAVRVTVVAGKASLYELMIDGVKAFEFRNRHELVDLIMQATSVLRYA
jgi:hypothetical protein